MVPVLLLTHTPMHQHAYRKLERLVAQGAGPRGLEHEIDNYAEADRVPLLRFAWGLLDDHADQDRADAMWLHAWLLEERQGGRAHCQHV